MLALLQQQVAAITTGEGAAAGGAAATATAGAVPPSALQRVRLLETVRAMYERHPRPKEFILKYRAAEVLRAVVDAEPVDQGQGGQEEAGGAGDGDDADGGASVDSAGAGASEAVRMEAQRLLNAFHLNALL